jgi:hypothetical protein
MVEAKFGRRKGGDDIPAVDKAIACRSKRSVVPGDEIRPGFVTRNRSMSVAGTFFLCASAAAAFAQSTAVQGQDRYQPLQAISYEFDSKFTSGILWAAAAYAWSR